MAPEHGSNFLLLLISGLPLYSRMVFQLKQRLFVTNPVAWQWECSSREPAIGSVTDWELPITAPLDTLWLLCQGHTYLRLLSANDYEWWVYYNQAILAQNRISLMGNLCSWGSTLAYSRLFQNCCNLKHFSPNPPSFLS